MAPETDDHTQTARRAWSAFACAAFVLVAVVLEFVGGRGGAAITTSHHRSIAPSAWPTGLRVAWWLAVAGASGGYRFLADQIGQRSPRIWLVALSAVPFLLFAFGVATNRSWATFR